MIDTSPERGVGTITKQDEHNALFTLRQQVQRLELIIQDLRNKGYNTVQLENVKKCLEDIILHDFHQTL